MIEKNTLERSLLIIIPKLIGGGAETFVKNFSQFILKERQQLKIHIYTMETNEKILEEYRNIGICLVVVNTFSNLYNIIKLYVYIRQNKITYIMSFLWKSDFIATCIKILRGNKLKLFVSERGDRLIRNKLHQKFNKIKNCIDKFFIFKYADYLVTNSIKTKYFLYRMGLDSKKFIYLPNLVADIYKSDKVSQNTFITFGYVGRLENEKNPFLALDYLYRLNNSNNKLIFFGEGRLLKSLKEYGRNLNLENQLEFKGYTVNKNNIYSNIDILINTSKIECSSNSCLEALVYGLKVISTKTFSYYELKQYFIKDIFDLNYDLKESFENPELKNFNYKEMSELKIKKFINEYFN